VIMETSNILYEVDAEIDPEELKQANKEGYDLRLTEDNQVIKIPGSIRLQKKVVCRKMACNVFMSLAFLLATAIPMIRGL
jgi:hypothetical protein